MNKLQNKETKEKAKTIKILYRVELKEGESATEKCVGCSLCEMACSLYHHRECNPSLSGIKVIKKECEWINGSSSKIFQLKICTQCGFCIQFCPVGAIRIAVETGAVVIDDKKCSGCLKCIRACPFDALWYNKREDKIIMVKCDLCDGSSDGPKCIGWCPKGVLTLRKIK